MNEEQNKLYVIKTTNPITFNIMTYKGHKPIISVGSDDTCDLILSLPSIAPIHLIVNYLEKKVKAIGNDVHCDTITLLPDNTMNFTNKSLLSIHNIFMMFLFVEENEDSLKEMEECDVKLRIAASKYTHYSPYLKIAHSNDHKEFNMPADFQRNAEMNREDLDEKYKKELGDFSEMPLLAHMTGSTESNALINPIIKKTEEELEALTTPNAVAAVINSQIADVEDNIHKAIDGVQDIGVIREILPDLGREAITNEMLQEAKKELETNAMNDNERNKILEAEIKSIEDLKSSITDSMKEEFRSTISTIIQEETKDQVEREVEKCFQESKFTQFVAETVAEHSKAAIEEVKTRIEGLEEVQDQIILEAAIESDKDRSQVKASTESDKQVKAAIESDKDENRVRAANESDKDENQVEAANESDKDMNDVKSNDETDENVEIDSIKQEDSSNKVLVSKNSKVNSNEIDSDSENDSALIKKKQNSKPKNMKKQDLTKKVTAKVEESPKKKKADDEVKSKTGTVKKLKKNEEKVEKQAEKQAEKAAANKKVKKTAIKKEEPVEVDKGRQSERKKAITLKKTVISEESESSSETSGESEVKDKKKAAPVKKAAAKKAPKKK